MFTRTSESSYRGKPVIATDRTNEYLVRSRHESCPMKKHHAAHVVTNTIKVHIHLDLRLPLQVRPQGHAPVTPEPPAIIRPIAWTVTGSLVRKPLAVLPSLCSLAPPPLKRIPSRLL